MIEVNMRYDLVRDIDQKAFSEWAPKAVSLILQQPGLVEYRAQRNVLGTPQVRATSVWQSLVDWVQFLESVWPLMEAELRTFATNLVVEVWRPSPLLPEPLHPPA